MMLSPWGGWGSLPRCWDHPRTSCSLRSHRPPPWPPDCYSETEAEDPDDESPRQGCDSVSGPKGHPGRGREVLVSPPTLSLLQPKKRLQNTPERGQLFPTSGESSSTASSPQGSPRPRSPEGRCWGMWGLHALC